MNAPDDDEVFEVSEPLYGGTGMFGGPQIAELRARAEKAEAALADYENRIVWIRTCTECDRLRDGIQALADEWEALDPDRKWGDNWRGVQADAGRRLRGLLSPTPEEPTP